MRDEPRGHGEDEAFGVEASGGMAFADLAMDGVGDEFELGVADLEAVANLEAGWGLTCLLGDGVNERFGEGEDKVAVVVVVRYPAAGGVGRDDVDVAVNGGAFVLLAVATTGELRGWPDVDAEDGSVDAGKILGTDGIETVLKEDAVGCLGLGEDLRGLGVASGWLFCGHGLLQVRWRQMGEDRFC